MLVVMADDGIVFDGTTPERAPLGGAEGAFVSLAEALAARGHRVLVRNRCAAPLTHHGVAWAPLDEAREFGERAGLYIANRGDRLIGRVPAARGVFWIHNPGRYLKKPRYVWALLRHRPVIVTLGAHHAATVPWWLPSGGRAVIPYGLAAPFRAPRPERSPPPPRAIFTSNPLRGLGWLLELWVRRIRPAVPAAELHIYGGPAVYGAVGDARAHEMNAVLARADALGEHGVRRHAPLPREQLVSALEGARVMLYRGDEGETFCLAVAEAQALGVPAVVQPLGAVAERIIDGVTGTIARDDEAFAAAAIALLGDDTLWRRQHAAALARQKGASWDEAARLFEELAA
ncbi:MAG TPA: glycosyltransferase [Stellaceae bacterium]|nr:glycosyltransferase [Stellaceae bacterium]